MSSFKERIDEILSSNEESGIIMLILDDCKNSNVSDIKPLPNLKTLSIVNAGLTSLEGFPAIESLEKLDISDNKISDGLENLKECPNLKQILLSGNKIKSLNQLQVLTEFKNLQVLELISCEVSTIENFREEVFNLLPDLVYLDGENREGKEYDYEESEETSEEEEEEESLSMADLMKADHSNDFLDDEEPYVPNENEGEESDESDISEEMEPDTVLSPSGVTGGRRTVKRKVDNGDVDNSPCKKAN